MRSALNFNTNNIAIMVLLSSEAGRSSRYPTGVSLRLVEIDNQVKTAGAGGRSWIQIEREVEYEDETIDTSAEEIHDVKKITYHIKGRSVNTYSPWVYYRSILEPEEVLQRKFYSKIFTRSWDRTSWKNRLY